MEYKVVSWGAETYRAADSLETLVSQYAKSGWRFHSINTVTTYTKPGCNKPSVPVSVILVVFEKGEFLPGSSFAAQEETVAVSPSQKTTSASKSSVADTSRSTPASSEPNESVTRSYVPVSHNFDPVSQDSPIQVGDRFLVTRSISASGISVPAGCVGVVKIVNPREPDLEFENGLRARCPIDAIVRIKD